jgi:hypothetical protein
MLANATICLSLRRYCLHSAIYAIPKQKLDFAGKNFAISTDEIRN